MYTIIRLIVQYEYIQRALSTLFNALELSNKALQASLLYEFLVLAI